MDNTKALFIILIAVLIFISVVIATLIKNKHSKKKTIEDMDGNEFESYCAELLKATGFVEIEVTKGSHDYGIDILAEKDGITYGIQCKRYSSPVGIKAIQEAYAGKDFYGRMVGTVMTNQYFTAPAVAFASKLNILLWDGGYLEEIEEEM